ncbi:hypothetical protein A4A49_63027 [Nicotiana attenuata]|uniref:DUF4408 domain-containing protein n=1 Tax=Nicotiana attenuata TaxID=49451 RepID=A0A1J6IV84_NICAT|nr:hypothetical protein A4A49_63027 [Nicotiana attenuata]
MAPSTNSLILSLKVVLISIGAVSLAMVLKASLPWVFNEFPTIWSVVIAWLKPLFLFIFINDLIAITQSELHSVKSEVKEVFEAAAPVQVNKLFTQVFEVKLVVVNGSRAVNVNPVDEDAKDEPVDSDAIMISKSVVAPL